jgi:tRNA A37 threonylcarbamoyladenosine synthetase subunit TsaC/SUA5/YrdC
VTRWAQVTVSDELLSALLPGPRTLLFRPSFVNKLDLPGEPELVGVRLPQLQFPCQVANLLDKPLALTSANFSGQPSALAAPEFEHLWPRLSTVFDGGVLGDRGQEDVKK